MSINVTLRTVDGDICRLKTGKLLQKLAMEWTYKVRNRNRWSRRGGSRENVAEQATAALREIGIDARQLRRLAEAGVVEVSTPFRREDEGWEARILPWEYLLSAATRRYRHGRALVVVRHLSGRRPRKRAPKKLTIVETAPGALRESFDFEAENGLVRGSLRELAASTVRDPTKVELTKHLTSVDPDVIHVTGIDAYLGAEILGLERRQLRDGIYLAHHRQQIELVEAEPLAECLNAGRPNPLLVGFNCWESGSRLAPLAVHHGAAAALGFQNTFDDSVAELFFVNFYRAWAEHDWDVLSAFLQAWEAIGRYHDRIRGSGIVLWSSTSLVRKLKTDTSRPAVERVTRLADPAKDNIRDLVHVEVQPIPQINYGLLHNNRSLFEKFQLSFVYAGEGPSEDASIGLVRNLEVDVSLNVGKETFPYRTMVDIGEQTPRIDLVHEKGGIHVSLISEFARSVSERVQTNLFVHLEWRNQLLYQHTFPVWLTPVDQWRLDETDIWWLPSFIQPRDPAVARIIDSAQRYLMCLFDDAGAGFAGYQYDNIDWQVQAIWSALIFDYRLKYINPPPSYRNDSQRLRTPSQTVGQGRGTCVDLAILMAACLEWIEVYPVIFMLDDHAFPGYWNSYDAYQTFCEGGSGAGRSGNPRMGSQASWILDRTAYPELKAYVENDELVPLETVNLTTPTSFERGYEDARKDYFGTKRNPKFHSMIDIASARQQVTPLPIPGSD